MKQFLVDGHEPIETEKNNENECFLDFLIKIEYDGDFDTMKESNLLTKLRKNYTCRQTYIS